MSTAPDRTDPLAALRSALSALDSTKRKRAAYWLTVDGGLFRDRAAEAGDPTGIYSDGAAVFEALAFVVLDCDRDLTVAEVQAQMAAQEAYVDGVRERSGQTGPQGPPAGLAGPEAFGYATRVQPPPPDTPTDPE